MSVLKKEESSLKTAVDQINKKAHEIVGPMIENMKGNALPANDTGVEVINSIWIVKPHNHVQASNSHADKRFTQKHQKV